MFLEQTLCVAAPRTFAEALNLWARLSAAVAYPRLVAAGALTALLSLGTVVALAPPRPPDIAGGLAFGFIHVVLAGLCAVALGHAAAVRDRVRQLRHWTTWFWSARQARCERAIDATWSLCSFAGAAALLGTLAAKRGWLDSETFALLWNSCAAGFIAGYAVGFRSAPSRSIRAAFESWRARQPVIGLMLPPLELLALFCSPAIALGTIFLMTEGLRTPAWVVGMGMTSVLALIGLAELRPATHILKPALRWTGRLAFSRLALRCSAATGCVMGLLCLPAALSGVPLQPWAAPIALAALVACASYVGLVREVAAHESAVAGSFFSMVHSLFGVALVLTLPVGGWIIPFHVRWLLQRGANAWAAP